MIGLVGCTEADSLAALECSKKMKDLMYFVGGIFAGLVLSAIAVMKEESLSVSSYNVTKAVAASTPGTAISLIFSYLALGIYLMITRRTSKVSTLKDGSRFETIFIPAVTTLGLNLWVMSI